MELLKEHAYDKHVLTVLNKSDLPSFFDRSLFGTDDIISLSCHESTHLLVDALNAILDTTERDDTTMLTSLRQLSAVKKAYETIEESLRLLTQGELELFAFHINEAIYAISSITKAPSSYATGSADSHSVTLSVVLGVPPRWLSLTLRVPIV